MVVYTARVHTESSDTYVWVYTYLPSREEVIRRLYEMEYANELSWYDENTRVFIEETELIERIDDGN